MIALLLAAGLPTIDVAPVAVRYADGETFGARKAGLFCAPNGRVTWGRDIGERDFADLGRHAAAAMRAEGARATFADTVRPLRETPDLTLVAEVAGLEAELCVPLKMAAGLLGRKAGTAVTGAATLSVHWSLYATREWRLVASVETSGQAKLAERTPGGAGALIAASFDANIGELLADPKLRAALR